MYHNPKSKLSTAHNKIKNIKLKTQMKMFRNDKFTAVEKPNKSKPKVNKYIKLNK